MDDTRRPALPALTGLRFFAALAVLAFHFTAAWGGSLGPQTGPTATLLSAAGYEAVSCFFVLSGFVLAYAYLDDAGRLRHSLRAFYRSRIARIYPVYLLATLLAAMPFIGWVHATWTPTQQAGTVIATALAVQGWWPAIDGAINTPSWSLSIEALFYALFPLLALLVARRSTRFLLVLGAGAWLLCLVPALMYAGLGAPGGTFWPVAIHALPLIRLPEFVIGMVAARVFCARMRQPTPSRIGVVTILTLVVMPLAILATYGLPVILREDGLLAPLWALLLYGMAWGRGPVASLCAARPLVVLGDVSYGLYILHWPLHDLMTHFLWPWPAGAGVGVFAGYVALCCTASLVSARYFERPARRAILHAAARQPSHAVSSSVIAKRSKSVWLVGRQ